MWAFQPSQRIESESKSYTERFNDLLEQKLITFR
jgi:hypothetical protein